MGQNVRGYLVVPCFSNEKLQTLQFIPPQVGKKLNLDGEKFYNGYFVVGSITNCIYLCEGLSAAWAVNKASNATAIFCFGTNRMMTVVHAELKLEKAVHAKHHPYGTKPRIKPRTGVARCTAAYPQDQRQKQDDKLSGTV